MNIPLRFTIFMTCVLPPVSLVSQSSGAAAAGLAAGAALGAGASQSSNTPSSAGASNAAIEMNIMVYGGIKRISPVIALDVANSIEHRAEASDSCQSVGSVLLEDSSTIPLLSLRSSWNAMVNLLSGQLSSISDRIDQNVLAIEGLQQAAQDAINQADQLVEKAKENQQQKPTKPVPPRSGGRAPLISPNIETLPEIGSAPSGSAAGGTTSGGTGSASTPIGLTYLGDIGTALSTLKSGMTYSSSSISPTTQALNTALAHDLCGRHILLYTTASTINLETASRAVSSRIIGLEELNADIQAGTNISTTLPTPSTDEKDQSPKLQQTLDDFAARIKTISTKISSDATVANQLLTTFLNWETSSDNNGGVIMTDVVRAEMISEAFSDGIPALQVSIDAAGGNTRTNNYFLLNLFYTPKPSFNAGVVVTYELRNKDNVFLAGDTLKTIYDYSKWKPSCFEMASTDVDSTFLGTGQKPPSTQLQRINCEPQSP